ncbi:alpha/beta hydrolase [Nocardia abscessus]|uniref:alpha/beta hydrolase n=1 Tax=Nocardia abscessus TaxID=120957 RepID=UPI0024568AF9|nr:alpha/beta fold hydrolase [Nocardia abscessus]
MRAKKKLVMAAAAAVTVVALTGSGVGGAETADATVRKITGTLSDGSTYLFEVPANWNGTLLLYSHGYNPGPSNPARDTGSAEVGEELLADGYALAGGSYPGVGWQTPNALGDQTATLDEFAAQVASPRRVIAWGESMGGEITSLLAERYPDKIHGAIAMCPGVAGIVPWFNTYLDGAFTLRTLLDPAGTVPLVNITDVASTQSYWTQLVENAQKTAEGRARLALAASFTTLPTWSQPGTSEPAGTDHAAQELNQYYSLSTTFTLFQAAVRADMESKVGGAFSWNTGVDYRKLFSGLGHDAKAEVDALYKQAGLSIKDDLGALQAAPRVEPSDPQAIAKMNEYAPTGSPQMPILTVHTTGDDAVFTSLESPYAAKVRANGDAALLRQTYVSAPGHCNFTTDEVVASIKTMDQRLNTGAWPSTSPQDMNKRAADNGTDSSHFVAFQPDPLPRPELYPSSPTR